MPCMVNFEIWVRAVGAFFAEMAAAGEVGSITLNPKSQREARAVPSAFVGEGTALC